MSPETTRSAAFLAPLLLATLLAGPARPDTIYLTDGSTLNNVEVVEEQLSGVTYKEDGKSRAQTVDADKVLLIDYKKLPKLIDEAEGLIREGGLTDGVERLMLFAQGVFSGENRRDREPWAPGYALDRVIHLRLSLGDWSGVADAADLMLQKLPDSRHAPGALLAKAEAMLRAGKKPQAQAALEALREMIRAKGLSQRWTLECELGEIAANEGLKEQDARDRLIEVASKAGKTYPVVRNRARVLEAQSYLAGKKPDFASARKIFDDILADPKADDSTLAAAYTGLGDCLFNSAADKIRTGADASAELQKTLMAYMRVVVRYKDETAYVPKAMFYAGRVFDLLGDEDSARNARRLYTTVIQTYGSTDWAAQARNYRK